MEPITDILNLFSLKVYICIETTDSVACLKYTFTVSVLNLVVSVEALPTFYFF